MSQYDIADLLTQILGRKINYAAMEIEPFKQVLKDRGFTPHFVQHISAVAQDCRDGVCSGTNDLVEKLTGQRGMEMADYITKNKALFKLPGEFLVSGLVYDVATGRVETVVPPAVLRPEPAHDDRASNG